MDTTKTPAPTAPEADAAEDATAANSPAATSAPAEADLDDARVTEGDHDLDPKGEEDLTEDLTEDGAEEQAAPGTAGGAGAAATAIVAAGLGVVALSGSWVSRVVAERQNLVNQLDMSATADNNAKIAALYSAPWHATALVNGVLAAIALLLAVFVLARPAFGAPDRFLPVWIRSIAWAAIGLAALGILLFGLMYFDLLLAAPTAAA